MKWKLDEALLNEMAHEMMLEAEQKLDYASTVLKLTEMLLPVVVDMRRAGGSRHQVHAVLKLAIDIVLCSSEEELDAKFHDHWWMLDDRA
jgi:hypothetical protein